MSHFRILFAAAAIAVLSACSAPHVHAAESATTTPATVHRFTVERQIVWAKPYGQNLTMDIYTPETGKKSSPVLVIFHGGGWLINNNGVMDSMSTYIAEHSEYVVCNVNYRLLGDNGNSTTMNQLIEDALGAIAWIKEFIDVYGGDPSRLVLTGDSAGGHLAAMALLCGAKLESDGFEGATLGYKPTYLPRGKTAEELARTDALAVQGAILSYPALDVYASCLGGFETPNNFFWTAGGARARGIFGNAFSVKTNPELYQAVSPVFNIPNASDRALPPQLCIVGSDDKLIPPQAVRDYVGAVAKAGHQAEYWEYAGRPHAFLDSRGNKFLGTDFRKDAPAALDRMIAFMNKLFGN